MAIRTVENFLTQVYEGNPYEFTVKIDDRDLSRPRVVLSVHHSAYFEKELKAAAAIPTLTIGGAVFTNGPVGILQLSIADFKHHFLISFTVHEAKQVILHWIHKGHVDIVWDDNGEFLISADVRVANGAAAWLNKESEDLEPLNLDLMLPALEKVISARAHESYRKDNPLPDEPVFYQLEWREKHPDFWGPFWPTDLEPSIVEKEVNLFLGESSTVDVLTRLESGIEWKTEYSIPAGVQELLDSSESSRISTHNNRKLEEHYETDVGTLYSMLAKVTLTLERVLTNYVTDERLNSEISSAWKDAYLAHIALKEGYDLADRKAYLLKKNL
ncbi:hypothetical protein JJQ59_28560 [Cupriavidus necator]|uniref:hypothetical protein n=1 Tax=Cupriavidus necator TaxID=106590 RepID=UPI0011BEA8B3|nr:hypothetical protein [Cupriavidus necator]QQX86712.1 hypothetical protein JJQ59_28560 [Cupriavidus necator]